MHRVRQQDLPFVGSSHQFVGADNGHVNVSVFLLSALPGRGRGRTDIPTTKCRSCEKAEVSGMSTARSSRPAPATFSW